MPDRIRIQKAVHLCDAGDVHQSLATGFSTLIRARQLTRPLNRAFTLEPHDVALASASTMKDMQFDAAPVTYEGRPIGVFEAAAAPHDDEAATVGKVMRPLTAELVVSSEMPLSALMRRMRHDPFLFVLDENGMNGFITPTDLGTVAVRTHFYLQLAHLESTLGAYLRVRYPNQQEAVSLLPRERQASQLKIAEDLRAKDRFIDDLSCISLDDLITIAAKDDAFKQAFRGSPVTLRTAKRGLVDFRNEIMHPTRMISTLKLVEREDRLAALIMAAESLASELDM